MRYVYGFPLSEFFSFDALDQMMETATPMEKVTLMGTSLLLLAPFLAVFVYFERQNIITFTPELGFMLMRMQDPHGFTPLHWNSRRGNTQAIRNNLHGLSSKHILHLLSIRNENNETALDIALSYNHLTTAEFLHERLVWAESDVNLPPGSCWDLWRTVLSEIVSKMRTLLSSIRVKIGRGDETAQMKRELEAIQERLLKLMSKTEENNVNISQLTKQQKNLKGLVQEKNKVIFELTEKLQEDAEKIRQLEEELMEQKSYSALKIKEMAERILVMTNRIGVNRSAISELQLQLDETDLLTTNAEPVTDSYAHPEMVEERPPTPLGEIVDDEDPQRGIQEVDG